MTGFWKNLFATRIILRVVGGQNLLASPPQVYYTMMPQPNDPGIVKIDGRRFYYFGFSRNVAGERSVGKAAAGAIVGGVLTGGIGAIAGGALGGRKKDKSTATLVFADFDSDYGQIPFEVEVACDKTMMTQLVGMPVCVWNEEKGTIWRP